MDDAARVRALFESTFPAVRRYVHHRGIVGGRADDVVAETFGIGAGAVRVRLHRARRRLSEELAKRAAACGQDTDESQSTGGAGR